MASLLEKNPFPRGYQGLRRGRAGRPLRRDAPCHHRDGLRKWGAFGLQPGCGGADRVPGPGLFPPRDTIVWDVGHQSYPYKLLTGRYPQFSTIRLEGGLAGFPCREESEYDKFTSGHSSASISAALGVSEANFLQGKEGYVVAVIGDGALTGGLAYEGLNNAGRLHRNLIVILNDNTMSISKNVGSMARYLSYIRTKPGYIKTKNRLERTLRKIPGVGPAVASGLRSLKRSVKRIFYNSTIFEDMGFAYYGPFDGHNIKELAETLETAKLIHKPVLLHIRTYKGKGYQYAEQDPTIYHGLSGFDVTTGDTGENVPKASPTSSAKPSAAWPGENRKCSAPLPPPCRAAQAWAASGRSSAAASSMWAIACSTTPLKLCCGTVVSPCAALTASAAACMVPCPFKAEISTTLQPSWRDNSSMLILSPFFFTTSIMLTATTTGIPSSVSCVVRYRLRSRFVPSMMFKIASGRSLIR